MDVLSPHTLSKDTVPGTRVDRSRNLSPPGDGILGPGGKGCFGVEVNGSKVRRGGGESKGLKKCGIRERTSRDSHFSVFLFRNPLTRRRDKCKSE